MGYTLFILTVFFIYTGLAASLNLLVGYTGLLSLTHAAFAGIGAYGASILMLEVGMGWLPATALAVLVAGVAALVLGIVTLPVRDVYYIVASFALQVIIYNVLLNWRSLTGGALGLAGIPKPALGTFPITGNVDYLIFTAIISIAIVLFVRRIGRSSYGLMLKSIREDEVMATVLGKKVARAKIVIFVVCSCLAALSGAVLAPLLTFIHPSSFSVHETIFLLAMVIIGGSGNVWGSVIGAAVLVGVPELLTFQDIGGTHAPQIRQILYGAALIGFMRWRPEGLLPERASNRRAWPGLLTRKRSNPETAGEST